MIFRLQSFVQPIFDMPRNWRVRILFVVDYSILITSFLLAMFLRLDVDAVSWLNSRRLWLFLSIIFALTIFIFRKTRLYRSTVRDIGSQTYSSIALGLTLTTILLAIGSSFWIIRIPRSVPWIFLIIALLGLICVRLLAKNLFDMRAEKQRKPVVIFGAGSAGRQLRWALSRNGRYKPVAFVDDKVELQKKFILDLKIYSPDDLPRLIERYGIRTVLLAVPSVSASERRTIIKRIEHLPVQVRTIPAMEDLIAGKNSIDQFSDVTIEELLGREPVKPDPDLMVSTITGKCVLVTGAGGSIGAEICRQVLRLQPKALILLDISEYALFSIDSELNSSSRSEKLDVTVVPILASIEEHIKIRQIMKRFGVQTVYHAAAYKHVPLVERNVVTALRNNVFGTLSLARAAIAEDVEHFVLISSDKAVRPTNVMGATKRLAELICQAHADAGASTNFAIVRFGNVLGSSGSVIPAFRQQISEGGPISVTHPEIVRYFMSIPEAAQLVIQAAGMARSGEVFVLDMGEPIRIVDLAKQMARLAGLQPIVFDENEVVRTLAQDEIAIKFTGLRPGEKLFEELLIGTDCQPTAHERIMKASEIFMTLEVLEEKLKILEQVCAAGDVAAILSMLSELPLAYAASSACVDHFYVNAEGRPLEK